VRVLKPSLVRGLTVPVLAAVLFAWIAVTALQPRVSPVDLAIRGAVHSIASAPLTAAMKVVTQLGGGWFLWPLGTVVVLCLLFLKRGFDAAWFAYAVLGANLIDQAMKLFFQRPRPEPFFGYDKPDSYSFPSGHSFVSFCFYLTLAEVLIRPAWPLAGRLTGWSAAVLLVLSIGFSRIYLGVHYPTDVMGGYAGALVWISFVRSVILRVFHRRDEPAEQSPQESTGDG
jgi:undecaprenyl-diphosphatase